MASPNPTTTHDKVEFQLPESEKEKLDEIAYELSSPQERVTRSDVLREAVRDYTDRFDADEDLSPRERGQLEPGGSDE